MPMERGSDKHSPRLDEEMEKETQSIQRGAPVDSRVEEFRQTEETATEEAPEPSETESPENRGQS